MSVYDCDNLEELWFNGKRLLERFNVNAQISWRAEQKLREEVQELANAMSSDDTHQIASEAVDVIVTVLNCARSCGLTYDDLETAVKAVCEKNDAKTLTSHNVINDLITRKPGYTWNGHDFVNE